MTAKRTATNNGAASRRDSERARRRVRIANKVQRDHGKRGKS